MLQPGWRSEALSMKPRGLTIVGTLLGSLVLMIWLTRTAPSPAALRVMDFAKEHGIAYSDYPQCLIQLMDDNPEAEDFVLCYPLLKQEAADLSGYDPAQGVPLFIQWDLQWGGLAYGGDYVAVSGSGAMCLAMAGWHLTGGGAEFYPDRVVEALREAELDKGEGGIHRQLISKGGEVLGLKAKSIALVEKKVSGYLKNGDPIVALMEPGELTDSARYILLTGWHDGRISINDPGSRVNSLYEWDFDFLAKQVKNLWVIHRIQ